jgi:hypothetical protein
MDDEELVFGKEVIRVLIGGMRNEMEEVGGCYRRILELLKGWLEWSFVRACLG